MDLNVNPVRHQERGTSVKTNASVRLQRVFGTDNNVFVEKICLETIVFFVRLLEFGISQITNVHAQHQKQSGMELIASVP